VMKPEKCNICKQYLQEIILYSGHLNKSCEEFIALTDERLSLFTGTEEVIHEGDELPSHKITHFSVYDKKGHLCAFDTGLVEKNVLLHVSGYIKPIYEEDSSPTNGIPAHDMGPINEWYIGGFDGGEKAIVGIVTAYAQYMLMEPSEEYAPFVKTFWQKISLVKLVIEFLLDHSWEDPTYEDLLLHIDSAGNSELSEDFLLQHAQFVCDQV
jgi:DNA (cytosine-5)-methyltransferase 1